MRTAQNRSRNDESAVCRDEQTNFNLAHAHHHQIKGVKLIRLKGANFIEDDLFEFEPSLRVSSGLALADYAYQLRRPQGLFLAFSGGQAALCERREAFPQRKEHK
jgi:hypothetical protein